MTLFNQVIVDSHPSNLALNRIPHVAHPGCCLTAGFCTVADTSSVAVVVVDAQGYFILANPAAEELCGYPAGELVKKHIFEVVHADTDWVASEFGHLAQHHIWSGSVLFQRWSGDLVKVAVNAHSSPVATFTEHVAFLQPTELSGPAIERLEVADPSLVAADLRVLQLIGEGLNNGQLAAVFGLSEVDAVLETQAVLRKLGVQSRTEAFIVARREGLIA